jgi:hypothetical protein
MDFLSQQVGPQTDPHTGEGISDGGFDVTMKLADLSDAALNDALSKTHSGSLLWVFRFVNGYQASAASARWTPSGGFSFGFNDYTTGSVQCGSDGEKCQLYPGDQPIDGKVNQAAGTITLSIPRDYLQGLNGPTGPNQRPTLDKARVGTRFYDATAFSLGNISPDPTVQSYLYPIDNPPAMDFLLPEDKAKPGNPPPGGGGGGGGACSNRILGTRKADTLSGTKGPDRIKGRGGSDRIHGGGGRDCLAGANGADRLSGGTDGDVIKDGAGRDRVHAGKGADVIHSRGGHDRIDCGPGKDEARVSRRDRTRNCEKVRRR